LNNIISINELWEIYHLPSNIICIIDKNGLIKTANPSFAQSLCYPEESLIGRAFNDFVHPNDVTANNTITQNMVLKTPVRYFTNRMLTSTGSYKTFSWVVSESHLYGHVYAHAQKN
jgi:PAS domain S-box-containing protein